MKSLEFRGHAPVQPYPSEAVDVEFAPDAIRPRRTGELLFSPPAGSLLGAYYDAVSGNYVFVSRSGNTDSLYIRSGSTNTQLASWAEAVADAQISFVPIQGRIAVVARSRIYLVDAESGTVTPVQKPSAPSGVTASARQEYLTMATYLQAGTDRCTVSYSAPYFTVDDNTNDSLVGAYQQLYATAQQDVGHCDDAWMRIESYDNELNACTATPIQAERAGNQDYFAGPSVNAMRRGWVQMPLTSGKLSGVHLWADRGAIVVHERLYFTPRTAPKEYRVTRVQDGFESEPLTVSVSVNSASCPAPGGYVVDFANLPSGTWRIYRRDSLGDWRLVAEGTGSTYTDTRREEDLGEVYQEPVYPDSGGAAAIAWQGRIVIVSGTKLYISEQGRYAWADDSDVLELPAAIRGIASIGGRLFVNYGGAWWELIGTPGMWAQRKVLVGDAPRPVLGCYVSDWALAVADRVYVPSRDGWSEIRFDDSHFWAWLLPDGMALGGWDSVYVNQRGRWSRWNIPAIAIWYANGRLEYATSSGVFKLTGDRVNTGRLFESIALDRRVASCRFYAHGAGSLSVRLNGGAAETWDMPHLRDRWRLDDWQMSVEIQMGANAEIKRVMLDMEASSAY